MKAWKAYDESSTPDLPVTNEILQAELAKIRAELAHVKTELIFWVTGGRPVNDEVHEELAKDHQEIRALRDEVTELQDLHNLVFQRLIDFETRFKALEMSGRLPSWIRPKSDNPEGGAGASPTEENPQNPGEGEEQ